MFYVLSFQSMILQEGALMCGADLATFTLNSVYAYAEHLGNYDFPYNIFGLLWLVLNCCSINHIFRPAVKGGPEWTMEI